MDPASYHAAVAQHQSALQQGTKRKLEGGDDDSDPKRTRCYRCGGHGHFAKACSSAIPAPAAPGAVQFACYKCNGKGHFARDCPNIRGDVCYNCGLLGHHSLDCPTSVKRKGPPPKAFPPPAPSAPSAAAAAAANYYAAAAAGFPFNPGYGYGAEPSPYFSDSSYAAQMSSLPPMSMMPTADPAELYSRMGYDMSSLSRVGMGPQVPPVTGCYRCGEPGHIARLCPKAPPNAPADSCYRCGQPGHIAKDCVNPPIGTYGGSKTVAACFRCGEVKFLSLTRFGFDLPFSFNVCRSSTAQSLRFTSIHQR
eukprot:TRINITY_DN4843_c0_g1_i2.p1 TRINITY_DN4843_c0_g1~~TRINITY_DN4843_c0_g1_i2.p1  ORF type:complete len:320 (-),score=44.14 TRINITY_DN4843_c0_g1_i2:1170-2093(-)